MKMMKTLAVAVAMLATVPAMAQYGASENENYMRVDGGYSAEMSEGITLSGFTANYTYGLSVSESHPMYVEFGGRLSFNSGKKINLLSLTVPVNFAWKFDINDKIAITPYTGLNFRLNLLATYDGNSLFKGSDADFDADDFDFDFDEFYSSRADWEDVYDQIMSEFEGKDGMSAGGKWKRFQMGWQIGAGVNYNKWYLGLEYGYDFIKIVKGGSTSHLNVTVGYTF